MEQRNNNRCPVTLNAKIFSRGRAFEGLISNVSEEGLGYNLTTFVESGDSFLPYKIIDLLFQLPSGETVEMKGEIRWFVKPSSGKKGLLLGLMVVDPPEKYTSWLRTFDRK
ncbi:MAG: hypothetical protein AMK70_08135 [Nitrospira bacterium SG8_35_1]|nr:MAG: hypothetical protein AMK70_08135 [Nitrospira bacterium SG8_35_1]